MYTAPAKLTRSQALNRLATHLRRHFGDRLEALYALKDDPYEPTGEDYALHLVAVFAEEDYDHWAVQDEVINAAVAFDRAHDFEYVSTVKVVSTSDFEQEADTAARAARAEGVLL